MSDRGEVIAARRALGRALAQLRRDAQLSQVALAARVCYSRTTLANVEVGRQNAARDFWQAVDGAVSAGGVLLADFDRLAGLAEQVRQERAQWARRVRFQSIPAPTGLTLRQLPGQDEDVERREFLRMLTTAGASLAVPLVDATPAQYVSATTLDQYAEANRALWQVFATARTKALTLPLVRDQLSTLTSHLGTPQTERAHRQLCALTADLLQLAGEIHFDGNRYGDAAQSYSLAASAGREAAAFDLWATAMVRHSFLSLYDGKPAEARPLLVAAERLAQRGDTQLATRHWVAMVQAQALSALGDFDGCQRALDVAEQVDGARSPGGWLRFDASRLPEERGACYVQLERSDLAEAVLGEALRLRMSARRRGSIEVDLAAVAVQQRDVGCVVDHVQRALAVAAETGSGWVSRKLHGLRPQLAPVLDDQRVRQLANQI